MVRKIRKDLGLAFPGKGKEIEHYGMSSPLHCHISSLVLSTCDQILHSGFFILYSSLNSVLILELLESNKVPIFKSMMRFDFFRDREAVQGLLLLVFNA